MTPAEHRRLAEEWLEQSRKHHERGYTRLADHALARAQVHATLAQEPIKPAPPSVRSWGW